MHLYGQGAPSKMLHRGPEESSYGPAAWAAAISSLLLPNCEGPSSVRLYYIPLCIYHGVQTVYTIVYTFTQWRQLRGAGEVVAPPPKILKIFFYWFH